MQTDFKLISIRGRIAYALFCFERLLIKNRIDYLENKVLATFIEKLWDVCSNIEIETIEEYINEIAPYSILDDSVKNDFNDYTFISFEEALGLKSFYVTLPADIICSMNILTEIAFGNLYGDTGEYSPITYNQLQELIKICKKHNVNLSNFNLKIESCFEELDGWGKPHPKDMWY